MIEDHNVIDEYDTCWVEGFENLPSPKILKRRMKRNRVRGNRNKPKLDDLNACTPEDETVKLDDMNAYTPEGALRVSL